MTHPEQIKNKAEKDLLAPLPGAEALEQAWFDQPENKRPSSIPAPPVETLGGFLGDPLADRWLR